MNNLSVLFEKAENPIQAIEKVGAMLEKSKMFDLEIGQGGMVALTCYTEGITLLDFKRKYHIVLNKLAMRTDFMLAELNSKGGKYKWIDTAETSHKAILEIDYKGNKGTASFSIEDAKNAQLIKQGGVWTKYPDAMLRARAISKAMRMYAPEIVAGFYSEEETESFAPSKPIFQKTEPVDVKEYKVEDVKPTDWKMKLTESLNTDEIFQLEYFLNKKNALTDKTLNSLNQEQAKKVFENLDRYLVSAKKTLELDAKTAEGVF